MIAEIRYVLRSLLRRRGFALVTVLTLALGIGAATAIYAVVDRILFQAPPSPGDLYMLGSVLKNREFEPIIWQPHFQAYSARKDLFSEFSAAASRSGNVVVERDPVATGWEDVSLNFFGMLRVVPALGRGFVPGEDVDGRNQVVIVTDGFARKFLDGPAAALGRKIGVNQEECTVVGILSKGERLPAYCESMVFRPLVLHPNPANPWDPSLVVIGRIRTGVAREQAESALAKVKVDLPPQMSWLADNYKPALSTIGEMQKLYRPELYWMLLGAVGFLFAIACLNATNLMLVHVVGKQLETSIRLALGGGRWGLIRLLLIETLGLCLCGSVLGALIANWLVPLFTMVADGNGGSAEWASWHLGWRTYLVLGGLTVVTGFAVALVPALHVLRSNIQGGLKNGGGAVGESPRLARLRATFVVLQSTFAVILLVGAGLMIQTFKRLEDVKLGFDPGHRVKMMINFPSGYPSEPKGRLAALNRVQDALQRVPGVSRVAYGSESLLAGYEQIELMVEAADRSTMTINGAYVSPDYREAGGMVLKGGRWLAAGDTNDVMINESLARARFGATNPVGQYLRSAGSTGDYRGWQVVGVVGDVRENLRAKPGNRVYMPVSWDPHMVTNFVVEMIGEPSGESVSGLGQAIFQLDPRIVTYSATPLADLRRGQLRNEHLALSVLKVLAAIAILLTVVGLFSVLAYTVDRRMGEFGIRMALGATPADLVSLVMRRGVALTVLGIAIGIAGAMGLTRYLRSLLFETPPYDPAVIAGVAGLLLLSALAACALPAVRASQPDVARLLKSD